MRSHYRIRRRKDGSQEVKVDDKFVVGHIIAGQFVAASTNTASTYLASKAGAELREWLDEKLATPPSIPWPPLVPMDPVPAMVVAIAPSDTDDAPTGWHYWRAIRQRVGIARRDAGSRVYRALASDCLPLPGGWRLTGMDDPISDRDRVEFADSVFRRMADHPPSVDQHPPIDTSDTALRHWRGDPCHQRDDILGAPVWMTCDKATDAGLMMFNSPHYHLIVREYAEAGKSRWTACTGTGSFMFVAPGPPSYATQREAIAAGVMWWRHGVVERIAQIAAARGGTCAWGVAIKPLDAPILTVHCADETAEEIAGFPAQE